MENELKYAVQVCSVSATGEGDSTIRFGCTSKALAELENFVDKEILLKFTLEEAEDEPMLGYIYNVHSSYGGKIPRYFTVKLDSSHRVKAGQILALTGQAVTLIIEIAPKDEPKDDGLIEAPEM